MSGRTIIVPGVVVLLAALLVGAAYFVGERSGQSAYAQDAMAVRIASAQVAEALSSETGAWRGLAPLLSPALREDKKFQREVAAWETRGEAYRTFAGYAIPDAIVQGKTAYVQLVWEYGERFAKLKVKGSPYADWIQVLDLGFRREGSSWALRSLDTEEIALVTPVFERIPWQGKDAGLVLPPVLPPPGGSGTHRKEPVR